MLAWIMDSNSCLNLSGHLLEIQDDKFGGLERCEADPDVDDTEVAIALSRRFGIAFHEVSITWRPALERALAKQVVHERADVQPNLR